MVLEDLVEKIELAKSQASFMSKLLLISGSRDGISVGATGCVGQTHIIQGWEEGIYFIKQETSHEILERATAGCLIRHHGCFSVCVLHRICVLVHLFYVFYS